VVQLVGHEHHHEVSARGGLDRREHLQTFLTGLPRRGGVRAQANYDGDAGVLEVECVSVALGAVADDRDGLAVKKG